MERYYDQALKSGEGQIPIIISEDNVGLDPGGELEITLPLDVEIEMYNGAPIDGANHFEISSMRIDGTVLSASHQSSIETWFPYNEYFDLSED